MKTEKQIEEEDERYLEVKLEAVKWMKDTDTWKLGTVNILTLFALHIEEQRKGGKQEESRERKPKKTVCAICQVPYEYDWAVEYNTCPVCGDDR